MKKIVCLILVLLTACGLFGGFAAAETGDADLFAQNLSEACYVQEGHFEYMDTIALASRGKLISCFGNNAGSGYLVPMIPPAPNQEAAPATEMGQFSWPAEEPSALYDPAAENQPANPYFSPVGWTYKLRHIWPRPTGWSAYPAAPCSVTPCGGDGARACRCSR